MSDDSFRCQNIVVDNPTIEMQEYFNDMQADFNKWMPTLLLWMQKPYSFVNEHGKIEDVSQEQVQEEFDRLYGASYREIYAKVAELFTLTGNNNTSNYGLFFNDYTPNTGRKITPAFKKDVGLMQSEGADSQVWAKYPAEAKSALLNIIQVNGHLNADELCTLLSREPVLLRQAGQHIQRLKPLLSQQTCKRPDNPYYCKMLAQTLSENFSSYNSMNELYAKETQELKDECEKQATKAIENVGQDTIHEFNKVCDYFMLNDFNMTGKVLKGLTEGKTSKFPDWVEIYWSTQGVSSLDKNVLVSLFKLRSLVRKVDGRKTNVAFPAIKKPQKFRVGLTGVGHFEMTNNTINICETGVTHYKPSTYFGNMKTELDPKGQKYNIEFVYLKKGRKGKKQIIEDVDAKVIKAVVKEIGVRKYNGKWYISIFYSMSKNKAALTLQKFFATAEPKPLEEAIANISVASVDLGIYNPLPVAQAKLNSRGKIPTDLGKFKLTELRHVSRNSNTSEELFAISSEFFGVKDDIKLYKSVRNHHLPIPEEVVEEYSLLTSTDYAGLKSRYERRLGQARTTLGKICMKLQNSGYNNVGDAIKLLQVLDLEASVLDAAQNAHLKASVRGKVVGLENGVATITVKLTEPVTGTISLRDFNTEVSVGDAVYVVINDGVLSLNRKVHMNKSNKRENFRKILNYKIASELAKAVKGSQVVFVENLTSEQNEMSNTNSLTRLFSARTLIKLVKETLQKYGTEVVEVDPRGTSQLLCFTNGMVARFKHDKVWAYYIKDDVLYKVDADLNASINILVRGLTHQIIPFKFYSTNGSVKTRNADGGDSKRIGAFLRKKFDSNRLFCGLDNGVLQVSVEENENLHPYEGYVYYVAGKFLSNDQYWLQKRTLEDEVKRRLDAGEIAVEQELSLDMSFTWVRNALS